jgi:hypothetical protein
MPPKPSATPVPLSFDKAIALILEANSSKRIAPAAALNAEGKTNYCFKRYQAGSQTILVREENGTVSGAGIATTDMFKDWVEVTDEMLSF